MRRLRSLACVAVLAALIAGCKTVGIPDVGTLTSLAASTAKATRPISDEEEYFVGRAVSARILSTYPLSSDARLTEYANLVGMTVALNSDKPLTYGGYHFGVLDTREPNAFASPGGTIFITKGMIAAVANEDELAAVLAHEVAHVAHRDGIAAIKSARWTEVAAIVGAEAVRSYTPGQLSRLVTLFEGSVDDVFKAIVVNGYSRAQERSADETALVILARSGYDPAALTAYLERLRTQSKPSEGGITATHPATAERTEAVRKTMPTVQPDATLVQKRAERFRRYSQ
jgi:predicted Zn-dependent protease